MTEIGIVLSFILAAILAFIVGVILLFAFIGLSILDFVITYWWQILLLCIILSICFSIFNNRIRKNNNE